MDLHFILLINLCFWKSLAIEYNTKAGPVEGKMHVYLVPRMHDNVGWPKTIDQYFVGSNRSLQVAAIEYIIQSSVMNLK
jgi:alpha-mannosidase